VELLAGGQRDEAVWLAFLTTHFGQEERNTVGLFYGKFGSGRWDWDTVSQNPDEVRHWMVAHPELLKRLKFGNHRKHETNKPEHPKGTAAIIESFVKWVDDNSHGDPYEHLQAASKGRSPELAFDHAYRTLTVTRFGRTARFDLLCLLGNLGILDVSPPHCYLSNATGPKSGAVLMVTGKKSGRVTERVDRVIRKLQRHLGVPVEAMEDALCNWQKRPKSARRTAELGYVTTTCG
jgi:Alpha-glutamyl/putrescinyl thymine pyrophosphorylase clade 3